MNRCIEYSPFHVEDIRKPEVEPECIRVHSASVGGSDRSPIKKSSGVELQHPHYPYPCHFLQIGADDNGDDDSEWGEFSCSHIDGTPSENSAPTASMTKKKMNPAMTSSLFGSCVFIVCFIE